MTRWIRLSAARATGRGMSPRREGAAPDPLALAGLLLGLLANHALEAHARTFERDDLDERRALAHRVDPVLRDRHERDVDGRGVDVGVHDAAQDLETRRWAGSAARRTGSSSLLGVRIVHGLWNFISGRGSNGLPAA